ncbi:hypothetical protein SAMN04515671_1103 [Nakamurella panacisegetis]|uniref:Uncharacterized protein n=2 Tax=Nakamurella panacisegetis TaxID=1090615 RepID=A0A1H0JZL2_9ACTN|nr:hypothetical protein SAMN04515671_1103 [Nakamurella panacisegetis]
MPTLPQQNRQTVDKAAPEEPLTLTRWFDDRRHLASDNVDVKAAWSELDASIRASWLIQVGDPKDALVRDAFVDLTTIVLTYDSLAVQIVWDETEIADGWPVVAAWDGKVRFVRIAGNCPLSAIATGIAAIFERWQDGLWFGPAIEPCPAWCTLHKAGSHLKDESTCEHSFVMDPAPAYAHVEVNVVAVRSWGQFVEPTAVEMIGLADVALTPSEAARLAVGLVTASNLAAGLDQTIDADGSVHP